MTNPAVVLAALRLGEPLDARWCASGGDPDELAVRAAGVELGRVRRMALGYWHVVGVAVPGIWYARNGVREVAARWLVARGVPERTAASLAADVRVDLPPGAA